MKLSAKYYEKSYQTHQTSWEAWSQHVCKCLLGVSTFPRKPERTYHWCEIPPLRILMKVRNLRHFVKLHFNISNSCANPKMEWQIRCEKHMGNAKGKARWISTKREGCFQHLSCLTHVTRRAFYSNLNWARRLVASSRDPAFWPLFHHTLSTDTGAGRFILENSSDIRHYWHQMFRGVLAHSKIRMYFYIRQNKHLERPNPLRMREQAQHSLPPTETSLEDIWDCIFFACILN